ncbi:host-nuclease inhibitor Gam family protein [uncultured Rhodospira sp.]|uniref:host-nuclease inhibitor Gam family protein n=1 Tax=uncultured Rhodospira sp. TaxID=1936189 RepID=UPI002611DDB1|nr:host-nuclease inhibitor Gam family protein [uncultured Rhodospira sp.]
MPTLGDIEALAKTYSEAHGKLADEVRAVEEEMARVKRQHLARIRRLVDGASNARDRLAAAVGEASDLFQSPRTLTLHGIKVGFAKGKGKLEYADAAKVCDLIRKHFPDQVETLVKTSETPVKGALNQLSVAELRRIGVTVVEAGDEVVVRVTDSEIDKMVDALLKDAAAVETAA